MNPTLSFLTTTSSIGGELGAQPVHHRLSPLGFDRQSGRIFFREHAGGGDSLAVLATTGGAAGALIPLAAGSRAADRPLLALEPGDLREWDLTTRVIQRRGLRVPGDLAPIRKFALGLGVRRRQRGAIVARGRAVATVYLRPRATLSAVWLVPDEALAVAILTCCGVPTGVGVDKQLAVLAVPDLH